MKTFLSDVLKPYLDSEDLFSQIDALQGEVYRKIERRRTIKTTIGGQNYFAKIHFGVGWQEIIKNLLQARLPVLGARNEWLAIKKLEAAGVPTMKAAAFVEYGWNPAAQYSAIVTHALENTISLEDYVVESPQVKRRLIEELATMSRRMHLAGLNHRDFYLCHFLMDLGTESEPVLRLIDLHRAQIREVVPDRWQVKDLGGLLFSAFDKTLTRRDLFRFMRAYRGQSLRETLANDEALWRRVTVRAKRLYLQDHESMPVHISALLNES